MASAATRRTRAFLYAAFLVSLIAFEVTVTPLVLSLYDGPSVDVPTPFWTHSWARRRSVSNNISVARIACQWNLSTEERYRSKTEGKFYGKYGSIREKLDYEYHSIYSPSRQSFQDSIIDGLLEMTWISDESTGRNCSRPTLPWVVFTAGIMGAGKTHTMKFLDQNGRFPLHAFVPVDPDQVRHRLPEFDAYVGQCPEKAGELTRKEAGMIAEILTEAALQRGQNVLVDGTLRNASWYETYFRDLRRAHPSIRIAILHVTAPWDAVLRRVMSRAMVTGRLVPRETLEETMRLVPESVNKLGRSVDLLLELHNSGSGDVTLESPGVTWDTVQKSWIQQCPAAPR